MDVTIPPHIQKAVDEYMEFYQVSRQLEGRMKELRERIEPFMKEGGLAEIPDSNRTGRVQLTVSQRASMTARFTTYDLTEISPLLDPLVLQRCVVEVIDKDRLEALSRLGEIPADVLEHKVTKASYQFNVRVDKV